MSDTDSEDDDLETMVIELGNKTIKAAFHGEKTCRYVSDECHIFNGELVSSLSSNKSVPVIDSFAGIINSTSALLAIFQNCWKGQYQNKSPSDCNLLLIVPNQHPSLLNNIADVVFSQLNVLKLCVISPGEGASLYEDRKDCIVLDIGHFDSRLEVFENRRLVSKTFVQRGGFHVFLAIAKFLTGEDIPSATEQEIASVKDAVISRSQQLSVRNTEVVLPESLRKSCIDSLFESDSSSASITSALNEFLSCYSAITTVIVCGSTSLLLDKESIAVTCGREIKYLLVPERNKMAFYGGLVAARIETSHRFHNRDEWKEHGLLYVPLLNALD